MASYDYELEVFVYGEQQDVRNMFNRISAIQKTLIIFIILLKTK